MKKLLITALLALADVLVSVVVKTLTGSTVGKRFIQGLVATASRSDASGAEKLAAVQQLIANTQGPLRAELNALPDTLKHLIIETAVAKLKHKLGQLTPRHE